MSENGKNLSGGLKFLIGSVILGLLVLVYLSLTPNPNPSGKKNLYTSVALDLAAVTKPVPVSSKATHENVTDTNLQKELEGIIQNALNSIKQGDPAKAYAQMSKEFTDETSLEKFNEFLKSYPEFSQFTSLSFEPNMPEEADHRRIRVTITSDKGPSKMDIHFVKEGPKWKISGAYVIESANYPMVKPEEKNELADVIQDELAALKEKDISKAYYAYASIDFKKATTLDAFKEFLKKYPILLEYTKTKLGIAFVEGELRILRLTLYSDTEEALMDVRFIKEGTQWKIWSMQLYPKPLEEVEKPKANEVTAILEDQISSLQAHDISKAYYAFTSEEFQKSASRDDFKKFIDDHSEFGKNKLVTIKDTNFEKSTKAKVVANLVAEDGSSKDVEYQFIKANGEWKILSIKILTLNQGEVPEKITGEEKQLDFSKMVLGTKVDEKGIVANPETTFKPEKDDINANLYIQDAKKDTVITVQLEYVETHSWVPPIKTTIEKDGDHILTFIFSPPPQGWLKGSYILHISSSTGVKRDFVFKVEEEKHAS